MGHSRAASCATCGRGSRAGPSRTEPRSRRAAASVRRTRSRGVAAALAGAAALVTTAFLLAGPGGPEATAADELAACARESPEQRRACFAGVFAREARAGNVAPTLAELEYLVDRGALDDCHLLAHTLAHAAVSVLGV